MKGKMHIKGQQMTAINPRDIHTLGTQAGYDYFKEIVNRHRLGAR